MSRFLCNVTIKGDKPRWWEKRKKKKQKKTRRTERVGAGYLIGSLQIGHQHLNLIGPGEDIYCYNNDSDSLYGTPTKTWRAQIKIKIKKRDRKRILRRTKCNRARNPARTCKPFRDKKIKIKKHLEAPVSIKLLSKFHLNPLIVNSITQTACMHACVRVLVRACVFCEWVCTCKPPLKPGHTKTEGLH